MQLQWIDLIIIGVIGLSALTGLFRGAVKEIIALGVWVVAIWAGYNYSQLLTPWVQQFVQNQTAQTVISFIVVVIGVLLAGAITNTIISMMLRRTGLSSIDKILGMIFGFGRGVFIVSLILAILKMTSLPYQQYIQSSTLCAQLDPVVSWISGYLPGFIDRVKSVGNNMGSNISNVIDTIPRY